MDMVHIQEVIYPLASDHVSWLFGTRVEECAGVSSGAPVQTLYYEF